MAQMKPAVAMVSENSVKCETMRMHICSIPSVQRVVNFTMDDGKMYLGEHFGGTVPEVATICDLPLLFVNGFPSSLEKLTLDQVETFVPYMIECCVGPCEFGTTPKWWPSDLQFCSRPQRPSGMQKSDWFKCLKLVVSNCYSYFGCEFALNLTVTSSRNKTSSVWPYLNNICDKPKAVVSNKLPCFGSNEDLKLRLPIYTDTEAHQYSHLRYHCAVCGIKFRRAAEMRRHKKLCLPKTCLPVISRHRTDFNRMSTIKIRLQNVRTTPNNNCSSQNKRTLRTLTENNPTRALQEQLTDNKRVPYVILHDCLKGNVKSNQTSHIVACAKPRPLSSLNREGVMNNRKKTPFKRKTKLPRRSLLPEGIRREKISILSTHVTHNCGACGEEFLSLEDKEFHVKLPCHGREGNLPPETTVDVVQTQETFLKYFGLVDSSSSLKQDSNITRTLRNPIRYSGVPISSPLGSLIFGRSRISSSVFLAKIEKVERYCTTKPLNGFFPIKIESTLPGSWEVSWKERGTEGFDHHYLFPLKRWWKSPMVWEKEFKRRTAYLKKMKLCKPCHVVLRRLNVNEVKRDNVPKVSVTFQAKKSLKMTFSMVPKIKRLTQKEIDAYTNVVTPMLKRLTDQEIKKYSK